MNKVDEETRSLLGLKKLLSGMFAVWGMTCCSLLSSSLTGSSIEELTRNSMGSKGVEGGAIGRLVNGCRNLY
jgi:hypothetical protein